MEGFEPPDGLTRQLISSQPRCDHFDTSPYSVSPQGAGCSVPGILGHYISASVKNQDFSAFLFWEGRKRLDCDVFVSRVDFLGVLW